jgi:DNA helicase-2/ATP-dependent DNA helicase PcrA
MLMVNALAGTGKTTTGLWGLGNRVPGDISISAEQKEIVRVMREFKGSQAAMAFNKTIADELANRAPQGCVAATANAFGNRAWNEYVGSRAQIEGLKNRKLCREFTEHISWKDRMGIEIAVDDLVSLCKCYMFDPTATDRVNWLEGDIYVDGDGAMEWLAKRFCLDITPQIMEYARKVFTKGVEMKTYLDFDDQIFMPLFYEIKLPNYGHLLVDEAQDLNRAKQQLAFQMGQIITAIGDRNQAIYGFSGADSEAMDNLFDLMNEDGKAINLPLNTTRRNPKAVVELARKIVKELRAAPDAKEGKVETLDHTRFLKEIVLEEEPSMILCRVNAPLTSLAFKMIAGGKRCYIQGRDIGTGLKTEIKKTGENNLRSALIKAKTRIDNKIMEIMGRPFPEEAQIEALNDRWSCIETLADNVDTTDEYYAAVDKLFKDYGSSNDTRLSSCHKSKGLEHKRVLIYQSNLLGRKAKQPFQTIQEKNLQYVAYTRSMDYLGLIPVELKSRNFEEE